MNFEDKAQLNQYKLQRVEHNYERYIWLIQVFGLLSSLFFVRNLYYFGGDWRHFPSYTWVYICGISLWLFFSVCLPLLYKKNHYFLLCRGLHLYTVLTLFLLVNLSLLDSFFINGVDFSAYIFGVLIIGFTFRANWRYSAILFIASAGYFCITYFLLRPDIFKFYAMLPLAPIAACAFYFSYVIEHGERKLFYTQNELKEMNRKLTEQSICDVLTGLHNRRFLDEVLEQQFSLFHKEGTPFLLFLQI